MWVLVIKDEAARLLVLSGKMYSVPANANTRNSSFHESTEDVPDGNNVCSSGSGDANGFSQ